MATAEDQDVKQNFEVLKNELKTERSNAKRQHTKALNILRQLLAEDADCSKIISQSRKVKGLFELFTESHELFHDMLRDENEIHASDEYYDTEQDFYITVMCNARDQCKASAPVKPEPVKLSKNDDVIGAKSAVLNNTDELSKGVQMSRDAESEGAASVTSNDSINPHDILSFINLPRVELQVFSGDPLRWHEFISAFDANVGNVCSDPDVKLTRLLQYTSLSAKNSIRGCLLIGGQKGYDQARDILSSRFGNPHIVTKRIVENLKCGKFIKSPQDTQQFADDLGNAYLILSQLEMLNEINSQSDVFQIAERFPNYVQNRWKRKAVKVNKADGHYPKFEDFVEFVKDHAEEVNDPYYGYQNSTRPEAHKPGRQSAASNVTQSGKTNPRDAKSFSGGQNYKPKNVRPEAPCVLCSQPHRLWNCTEFKALNPRERYLLVVRHKLCHNCLQSHETSSCSKRSVCGVPGCNMKHTKFIHGGDQDDSRINVENNVAVRSCKVGSGTCMPIVPVTVNGHVKAFCLLDGGSTNSFCTRDLARSLGIQGESLEINLNTVDNSVNMKTEVVSLNIATENGSLNMPGTFIIDHIPSACAQVDKSAYAHLQELDDLPAYQGHVKIDLLIGQDNAEALIPLEVRRGKPGDPFAVRTILGWSLNGKVNNSKVSRSVITNHVTLSGVEADVSKLWEIENEGLVEENSWSQDDKLVIDMWDREHVKVDGHYELGIPWENVDETVPNNFHIAKARLDWLFKKKFKARDDLKKKYDVEIETLLAEGYAEEVSDEEFNKSKFPRVWYLPHHSVESDKKPGRVRVVFDCASKYGGKSFNDRCKQGPNLLNKLQNVLVRFRTHPHALQADVRAMYNQVRLPVRDRDMARFLYYADDGKLKCFRLATHFFGGIFCSASSTWALRRTLEDSDQVSPLVAKTVRDDFYVDDCLTSQPTTADVLDVAVGLCEVCDEGKFYIHKMVSTCQQVHELVDEERLGKEVRDKPIGPDTEGKALGVKWNMGADTFEFEVKCSAVDYLTRRKMLSIVSAIFDPLGLIGPLVLPGKLLFQEVTASKLKWDDVVPDSVKVRWDAWLGSLSNVQDVKIPRCFRPGEFSDSYMELHHFADSSSKAYGCCSYVRCTSKTGRVHVQLICSKCRVAPIKQVTIPRLELQAAVTAVKVDSMLKRELNIQFDKTYFWSDSEIVLKYICNDNLRFHVYVGNRVGMIRRHSDPGEWYFVSGKVNPADLVSRGESFHKFDMNMWLNGPEFLHDYQAAWPKQPIISKSPGLVKDPEIKKAEVCVGAMDTVPVQGEICVRSDPLCVVMDHYSSWYRTKRAIAWWLRLMDMLRGNKREGNLTADEVRHAGVLLIKKSQSQSYGPEVRLLKAGKCILKSSSLTKLCPFMDDNGVLCVGGRLKEAPLVSKHPCIISDKHVISKAIVRDFHDISHLGVEWTLSNIRTQFWIVRARRVIKGIARTCVTCKRLQGKPCTQLMGQLPGERVESGKAPFTYCAIDIFGPYWVKYGRGEIKRYGCLYTCLSIRAIHVEVLETLDTQSFINAFRRFSARRGCPEVIYSDNGTNLSSGDAELRRSMQDLSRGEIESYAVKRDITWHFIPPTAAHMGGVYERMIGTFKRVMRAILPRSVRLTDEIISTIFAEAEAIVNGRPLVKMDDSLSALTPNHLLLLRQGPSIPPGKFDQDSTNYRKRWRYVQHLADQFWRKWVKSYLPELQRRTKWTNVNPNIKVNDLVMIVDQPMPRYLWPLAIVKEVNTGRDGLVRSVRVRTRTTELVRPITKIVLLEGSKPNV